MFRLKPNLRLPIGVAIALLICGLLSSSLVANKTAAVDLNPFKKLKERLERDLNGAKAKLKVAEKTLSNARAALKSAEKKVTSAKKSVAGWKKKLNAAKVALDKATASYNSLKSGLSKANKALSKVSNEAKLIGNKLSKLREELLKMELIAFDFKTPLTFSYNFSNNAYFFNVDFGKGLSYDTKKLEGILEGSLQLPAVNPVEAASSGVSFHTTKSSVYKKYRDDLIAKHGAENIYVASERFVNWAGPENMLDDGVKAYFGQGKEVAKEILDQLQLEFDDIVSWLKMQGESEAEKIALKIIEGAFSGKLANISLPKIKGIAGPVNFKYKSEFRGMSKIPQVIIAKKLGANIPEFAVETAIPHLGFAIIIERDPSAESVLKRALKFLKDGNTSSSKSFLQTVAANGNDKIKKLVETVGSVDSQANAIQVKLRKEFRKVFSIDASQLASIASGSLPVIDLRGTPIAEKLIKFLDRIALGNQGSVALKTFELDLSSLRVNVVANVIHRHSWGTLPEAASAINKAVGQASVSATSLMSKASNEAIKALESKSKSALAKVTSAKKSVTSFSKAKAALASTKGLKISHSNVSKKYNSAKSSLAKAEKSVRTALGKIGSAKSTVNSAKSSVDKLGKELRKVRDKFNKWKPSIRIGNPFG